MKRLIFVALAATALSGCNSVDQLGRLGRAPKLSDAEPVAAPPVELSLGQAGATLRRDARTPTLDGATPPAPNASLFRAGAGAFLGDQRASRVGDILTVRINVADKAELGNNTSTTRAGSQSAGVSAMLGLDKLLPKSIDPTNLASSDSKNDHTGGGSISRSETIDTTMAAIVTQVLPNGNLVIKGSQEVRVNNELRVMIVTGIVRPQDISRDNSIEHSQIAEARISYGGRGQLSDEQQARWGQQILDAILPF
ncbi:MAG: flagellar basal body L-ring protein FlgH [Sphingomonas sp.]